MDVIPTQVIAKTAERKKMMIKCSPSVFSSFGILDAFYWIVLRFVIVHLHIREPLVNNWIQVTYENIQDRIEPFYSQVEAMVFAVPFQIYARMAERRKKVQI